MNMNNILFDLFIYLFVCGLWRWPGEEEQVEAESLKSRGIEGPRWMELLRLLTRRTGVACKVGETLPHQSPFFRVFNPKNIVLPVLIKNENVKMILPIYIYLHSSKNNPSTSSQPLEE